MARKPRIEYAGAYYHVLNRGNYRSWIFESEGTRESFLGCLQECCNAQRWSFQEFGAGLESAGGLANTPKGRRLYRDYLGWLSEEDSERKRLGFERMSIGWAKGTKDFKKAVS